MDLKPKLPTEVFNYCPQCGSAGLNYFHQRAFRCEQCQFEYFFNSSGAVIALIYNEQGHLLVTRRAFDPWKGELDLPGGFIDPNETAEEAVRREIKEELNLEVTASTYLFSSHNQYPYAGVIVHSVDLVFRVEVKDFTSLEANDDVSEIAFIPPEHLKSGMFAIKSCNDTLEKLNLPN